MQPIGPKIAQGRDGEIFEHGPGLVLRRVRDGRSLEHEARVMTYVRESGYPVPTVRDAGDGWLVMDRIVGRPMLDVAVPLQLGRYGRVLADLHNRLHEIPAPDWLSPAPIAGDRMVHGDFHALNVLITDDGPVVIDWTNAGSGDPAYDVADAWLVFACASAADVPMPKRLVVPLARRLFLRAFLGGVDADAGRRALPAALEHRAMDHNMSADELARMRAFVGRASNVSAR